jgi:hypothetical protein
MRSIEASSSRILKEIVFQLGRGLECCRNQGKGKENLNLFAMVINIMRHGILLDDKYINLKHRIWSGAVVTNIIRRVQVHKQVNIRHRFGIFIIFIGIHVIV